MKMKLLNKQPLALAISAAVLLTSGASADDSFGLEEVVVTAQKRAQSLQDVPVAVTAFNAFALETSGVSAINELQKVSPNTTLQVSRGTNSTLTAYIRGIGQQDPLWGFEPGVGLYLDDIYIARPQGAVLDVYDVERIEILRGPQGTLYGKNTIGGAVKYVTRLMGNETNLDVKAAVGSYGQQDITVRGQIPIVEDVLYIGGAVSSIQRDGFGENILTGKENYDKDVTSARISLEWHHSDDISVRFSADDTQDDSNAKGGHRLTVSNLTNAPVLDDVFDSRYGMTHKNEVSSEGQSLIVTWDINDQWSLKSITAHREGKTTTAIDFDNLPSNDLDVPAIYEDEQDTQELQLSFSGERLQGVMGLYYYDGDASGAFDVVLGNVGAGITLLTAGTVETKSIAAYAHGSYVINEQWSVTVGGRYTKDKKDAEVLKQLYSGLNSPAFGNAGAVLLSNNTDYSNDETFTEFSPSIGMEFKPSEDTMLYAKYSQGFKSGGFDMRGDQTANPNTVNGFDPETVDSYELGIKTQLWDNRIRLNAALFYTDYDDLQITVQEGVDSDADGVNDNFVTSVLNAGKATIQGVELEMHALLTEDLTMTLTVGSLDTEIDEFISGGVDIADQTDISNTPDMSTHLGFTYSRDLGSYGSVVMNTAWSYRSEVQIFESESVLDPGSYTLWDAGVTYYSTDEHWTVGLYGKNLTDKEYRVAGYNFPTLGSEGSVIGYYGDPRTLTLSVNYAF